MAEQKQEFKTIEIGGGWVVHIAVDSDNHLNIFVKNKDGSQVIDTEEGLQANEEIGELQFRLTTEKIEEDYKEEE